MTTSTAHVSETCGGMSFEVCLNFQHICCPVYNLHFPSANNKTWLTSGSYVFSSICGNVPAIQQLDSNGHLFICSTFTETNMFKHRILWGLTWLMLTCFWQCWSPDADADPSGLYAQCLWFASNPCTPLLISTDLHNVPEIPEFSLYLDISSLQRAVHESCPPPSIHNCPINSKQAFFRCSIGFCRPEC